MKYVETKSRMNCWLNRCNLIEFIQHFVTSACKIYSNALFHTFVVKNVECLISDLVGWLSMSMRDIESRPPLPLRCPLSTRCWFSSTLVENLFANLSAFGDRRKRSDFDNVGGLGSMIGCALVSDVILWITRTPSRTIDRRVNRSSS